MLPFLLFTLLSVCETFFFSFFWIGSFGEGFAISGDRLGRGSSDSATGLTCAHLFRCFAILRLLWMRPWSEVWRQLLHRLAYFLNFKHQRMRRCRRKRGTRCLPSLHFVRWWDRGVGSRRPESPLRRRCLRTRKQTTLRLNRPLWQCRRSPFLHLFGSVLPAHREAHVPKALIGRALRSVILRQLLFEWLWLSPSLGLVPCRFPLLRCHCGGCNSRLLFLILQVQIPYL